MLTKTNFIGLRGRVSPFIFICQKIYGWEMEFISISFYMFFLKNNYYFVKKLAESLHISFFCIIFVVEIKTTTKTLQLWQQLSKTQLFTTTTITM